MSEQYAVVIPFPSTIPAGDFGDLFDLLKESAQKQIAQVCPTATIGRIELIQSPEFFNEDDNLPHNMFSLRFNYEDKA